MTTFVKAFLRVCAVIVCLFPALSSSAAKKHGQCESCHTSSAPNSGDHLISNEGDPSSICSRCHQNHRENHHPVDFVPTDSYYVSSGKAFPLFKGVFRCLTCHDYHGGTGLTMGGDACGPSLSSTPNFLRGTAGSDRREFCFQCHFQERYAEIDPHIMLDDRGLPLQINSKPICAFCHLHIPETENGGMEIATLRADASFLCLRCHPPMPGDFYNHHYGVKVAAKTIRHMRKSEKDLSVILPLTPGGRTTCATCHNPHQKEVKLSASARAGADSQYRLRVPKQDICNACHSVK